MEPKEAIIGNMMWRENLEPEPEPEPERPPIPYKWTYFNITLVGIIFFVFMAMAVFGITGTVADAYVYNCNELPEKETVLSGPSKLYASETGTVVAVQPPTKREVTPQDTCYEQNLLGVNPVGFIGGGMYGVLAFGGLLYFILLRKKEIEQEHAEQYGQC